LSGDEGYASAGAAWCIDASTVRKWVAAYQAHGDAGLSREHSHYDAGFKLSVLPRMWVEGLSYRQTAALFNIRNAGCLAGWEALAPHPRGRPRSMPKPPTPEAPAASDDEARIREELLAELNYLRMENAYLKNWRP
jgi:transposase